MKKLVGILLTLAVALSLSLVTATPVLAYKEGPGTNWWYIDAVYDDWKTSGTLEIELNGDSSDGQVFMVGETITITGDLHAYAVMCAGTGNEAYTDAELEVSGPSGSASDTASGYDFDNEECAEVDTQTTLTIAYTLTAAGTHTVYMYSYAEAASWWAGVDVDDFADDSLTFEVRSILVDIDHAKIDFKKKADDDKVHVRGTFELALASNGVDISEDVIVTVGPLSETITMELKGKKGEKWQYKRPKDGEGHIKKMTINWKNGKFDIRMDKADLTGIINPVTISIQIGDDLGEEIITMREKKHHWDYKAK